jgi:hypothetical protein
MRPNVLRRATSAAGSKRVSPPASVKSNEAMLPHGLGREDKFHSRTRCLSHSRFRTSSPSMARTSGDLVSGIGVVAEQWNRQQDGDVERQKQGAGEGHTAQVHRIVSQTQLNLLKRCKFRLSYRPQCRTTCCADWVSLLRSAASASSICSRSHRIEYLWTVSSVVGVARARAAAVERKLKRTRKPRVKPAGRKRGIASKK